MITKNLHFATSKHNFDHLFNLYGQHNNEFEQTVYFKAYDILSDEILNYRFFPIQLPNSKEVVKVTMTLLKKRIIEYDNIWEP